MSMYNKRGQGLSTTTIVIIILAVLVLVILILAASGVFGDLFDFINPSNNVNDVVTSCATFCSMKDRYNFCNVDKELYAEDGEFEGSCYTFSVADGFGVYGIVSCPDVNCKDYVKCNTWSYTEGGTEKLVEIGGVSMKNQPDNTKCDPTP